MIYKNNPAVHAQASGTTGLPKTSIVAHNILISKNL